MTEYIFGLLGDYTMQFIINISSLFAFLFCTFLFASMLKRRKWFALRLTVSLVICLICYLGIAVIRTDFPSLTSRILTNIVNYAVLLPLLFICYQDDISNILLCWCAGFATQEVGAKIFSLLLNAFGVNDQESMSFFVNSPHNELRDWGIYILIHTAIYFGCFMVFRRTERFETDRSARVSITALSVTSMLFLSILSSITREYQAQSHPLYLVSQMFSLISAFFILFLRTGILSSSKYRNEISLMEQVLYEERKQYQSNKENIDIINMKCHDLKHQLANISSKLTEQEIQALQQAIRIYDNNIKTGNEVLDVILHEKQLICQKEGIQLSCMANGELLGFMRTTHIYALFNNALGNALDAVRKLSNPEKKIIGISITQDRDILIISVTNYFEGTVRIKDGLPVTTKDDHNHHGFGVMSMRYITELYHGTFETSAEKDIFTLELRIPLPS